MPPQRLPSWRDFASVQAYFFVSWFCTIPEKSLANISRAPIRKVIPLRCSSWAIAIDRRRLPDLMAVCERAVVRQLCKLGVGWSGAVRIFLSSLAGPPGKAENKQRRINCLLCCATLATNKRHIGNLARRYALFNKKTHRIVPYSPSLKVHPNQIRA